MEEITFDFCNYLSNKYKYNKYHIYFTLLLNNHFYEIQKYFDFNELFDYKDCPYNLIQCSLIKKKLLINHTLFKKYDQMYGFEYQNDILLFKNDNLIKELIEYIYHPKRYLKY
uniref:Uncharacterized protein n=1 Tax=viral metagenome TaxID=1070528 RepID=A0A6C0H6N3_9ZZZZ